MKRSTTAAPDFFSWQGNQQQSREGPRGSARIPRGDAPASAPLRRGEDEGLTVEEHSASTTVVKRIREALLQKLRRGE